MEGGIQTDRQTDSQTASQPASQSASQTYRDRDKQTDKTVQVAWAYGVRLDIDQRVAPRLLRLSHTCDLNIATLVPTPLDARRHCVSARTC